MSAAAPAPADGQKEHEQEEGDDPDQGANPDLPRHLLAHRHMGPVHLLPVLVLQAQDVVLGGGLVNAQDVQGGDVAVVHSALPLLLHGEHVVAGAGHQGQFGLHALNLPGLLGQRGAAELHLDARVRALDEEEVLVVAVDPRRAVHPQADRLAAAAADVVADLAVVLALVLIPDLGQPQCPLVADDHGAPGGVTDPAVHWQRVGLSMASELYRLSVVKLVHAALWVN